MFTDFLSKHPLFHKEEFLWEGWRGSDLGEYFFRLRAIIYVLCRQCFFPTFIPAGTKSQDANGHKQHLCMIRTLSLFSISLFISHTAMIFFRPNLEDTVCLQCLYIYPVVSPYKIRESGEGRECVDDHSVTLNNQ